MSFNSITQRITRCFSQNHFPQLLVHLFLSAVITTSVHAEKGTSTTAEYNPSTGFPDGELRKTGWQDMLPHTMEGSYYNEFWNYHLFLENDLHLHITFSLANFGNFKSAVSGGKLFVSNFKGNNYHVLREFPLERLVIDESSHKIRLHSGRNIHIQGRLPDSHHITFQATKDNVSYLVELELFDIEPGYTWGDGIFRLDGHNMGIFVHIPKAGVRGTVAINNDTLQVNGTAYMDHTFQTDLSSKLVDKGFRFISHTNSGYDIGYFLIPKRRALTGVVGIGLQSNDGTIRLNKPEDVTVESSGSIDGRTVPERVGIRYRSGEQRILQHTEHFQHISFLEEVGGFRRRLVRSFLGGEVIEYVGTGKLNKDTPINYNFFIVH